MSSAVAQLIVQFEGELVRTVPLTPGVLTIGRTADNDLMLRHPDVARTHAELLVDASGALLNDLGSTSGTFIGDTRLLANQPQSLADETVFQIGPFVLTYQVVQAATEAEPAAAPGVTLEETPTRRPLPTPPAAALPVRQLPNRPPLPTPSAEGPLSRYIHDLPVIFHDDGNGNFLGRFLLIFESIWEPLEQRQDNIAMYFNPRTCPPRFLPWLAGWLGLTINPHWPEWRTRELLTTAMDLYRWRGTRQGLVEMLEVCLGMPVEVLDTAQPFVVRIRVEVPADSSVDTEMIEDLIRTHKPAHIGYILELSTPRSQSV